MATRTIANAGGNWSATGTWVEGAVPTNADDVVATATSGNLTINAAAACRSINLTGYTKTVTHNGSVTLSVGDGTAPPSGVALLFPSAGWTYTPVVTNTSVLALVGSSGTTKTVDFGGKTLGTITVDTAAGTTHQLVTNNVTAREIKTLNSATLDTNGRTATVVILTQTSATASLILGASTINCSSTWNTSSGSVSGASATIAHTGSSIDTASGQTYGTVTWSWSDSSNRSINVNNGGTAFTVGALSITPTGSTGAVRLGTDVTVTGLLTITGGSSRTTVEGGTNGTRVTLSAGSVSLSNIDFQDIAGSGAATWSGTSIADGGNNTGITFTTPVTRYWVGGTGTWDTSTTHWSATSGGSSGASVPLVQDTAIFDANSFTGAGQTLTMSASWLRHGPLDFSAITNNPTINFGSASHSYYGSITLPPLANATLTGTSNQFTFEGRGNHTITSGGRDWGTFTTSAILVDCGGGTYTLADDFTSSSPAIFTLTSGTFNSNGYAVSAGAFASSSATATRTLTMGSSTWTLGGTGTVWNVSSTLTVNSGTSLIRITNTSATAKNFIGGGKTYYDVTITGTGTGAVNFIGTTNNTFHDLTIGAPKTIQFRSSQTQTITGTLSATGTAGNLVTITASTAGSAATLSKASGTVTLDYVSLKDSAAAGGASWYAGSHSTDVSGNSGWTFTDLPITGSVTFAATSGLALAGASVRPGAVTLAATATLGSSGTPVRRGNAALAGAADLTVTGTRVSAGATALAATAGLAATGIMVRPAALDLAATSALAVAGLTVGPGAVSLAGSVQLAAVGDVVAVGSLTAAGVATLTLSPSREVFGALTLAGVAQLALAGRRTTRAALLLATANSLALAGRKATSGHLPLAATMTLLAAGHRAAAARLDLPAGCQWALTAVAARIASCALATTSALLLDGRSTPVRRPNAGTVTRPYTGIITRPS